MGDFAVYCYQAYHVVSRFAVRSAKGRNCDTKEKYVRADGAGKEIVMKKNLWIRRAASAALSMAIAAGMVLSPAMSMAAAPDDGTKGLVGIQAKLSMTGAHTDPETGALYVEPGQDGLTYQVDLVKFGEQFVTGGRVTMTASDVRFGDSGTYEAEFTETDYANGAEGDVFFTTGMNVTVPDEGMGATLAVPDVTVTYTLEDGTEETAVVDSDAFPMVEVRGKQDLSGQRPVGVYTLSNTEVESGGELTLTVSVKGEQGYTGPADVTVRLPEGVDAVENDAVEISGREVSWNVDSADSENKQELVLKTMDIANEDTKMTGSVSVSADGKEPHVSEFSFTVLAKETVYPSVALSSMYTKVTPGHTYGGDKDDYLVKAVVDLSKVQNFDKTKTVLQIQMPESFLADSMPLGDWDAAKKLLTYDLGTVEGIADKGSVTLYLGGTIAKTATGAFEVSASLEGNGWESDPVTYAMAIDETQPEEPVVLKHTVSLKRTDTAIDPVKAGDTLQYALSVNTNGSKGEYENMKLHFAVPEGVKVTGVKAADGSSVAQTDKEAVYTIGKMGADVTRELTVTVTVNDPVAVDEIHVKGYATYGADDKVGSEAELVSKTVKEDGGEEPEVPEEDLLDAKPEVLLQWGDNHSEAVRYADREDELEYKITVTNKDEAKTLKDGQLYLPVPEGMTVTDRAGGTLSDTGLHWSLGDLEAGMSVTKRVKMQMDADTDELSMSTKAELVYDNAKEADQNEQGKGQVFSGTLTVKREVTENGALSAVLEQNGSLRTIHVDNGKEFTYTLTVAGTGKGLVENVVAVDDVPTDLQVVSVETEDGSIKNADGTVTWKIGDLSANESAEAKIVVKVPETADGDSFVNKFTVTGDGQDEVESNSVTAETGTAVIKLDLYQRKGDAKGTKDKIEVSPEEEYAYVVVVKNDGNGLCDQAQVKLSVPSSVEIEDLDGASLDSKNVLTWNVYDLEAGDSEKFVVKVSAPENLYNATGSSTGTYKNGRQTVLKAYAGAAYTIHDSKSKKASSNTVQTVVKWTVNENSSNTNNSSTGNKTQTATKPVTNKSGVTSEVLSKTTGTHMIAYADQDTIIINTKYTKLEAGHTYQVNVSLIAENGAIVQTTAGVPAIQNTTFTAQKASGDLSQVEFNINGKDYTGKKLIGIVSIVDAADAKKEFLSSEADLLNRTVYGGVVSGVAMDQATVSLSNTASNAVTVKYSNLAPNTPYHVVTVIMDRSTKKPMVKADGKAVMGSLDFRTDDKTSGSVEVPIQYGATDYDVTDTVVYVTLYDGSGKIILAVDQDMNNETGTGTGSASGSSGASGKPLYATAVTGEEGEAFPVIPVVAGLLCVAVVSGGLLIWSGKQKKK